MNSPLPIVKKIDVIPNAAWIYERLGREPYSFLLESSMVLKEIGEYSFLGCDPFLVVRASENMIEIERQGNVDCTRGNSLDKLNGILKDLNYTPTHKPFPFNGGAVGFFSYDLGRQIETVPSTAINDLQTPDYCLGFYDLVIIIEHFTGEVYISSTGLPLRGKEGYKRAGHRLNELENILANNTPPPNNAPSPSGCGLDRLKSNFTPEEYIDTVQKVQNYIGAGEILGVNITQRFDTPLTEDSWEVYKRLRQVNGSPFGGYLKFGDFEVLSSSPERFLKVTGSKVETRPIKGTRPRGKDQTEDMKYRQELLKSDKDKEELLMVVEMEKNNLSRVCKEGTVWVPDLIRLEEYPTVFHLVSTVEGELPPNKTICDLLKATFPGGSITGVPKTRSMEIIEELEKIRRGIYTGSIGYIDFNGDADLNIVIRTIICRHGKAYFQVGGAVTADSEPRQEYYETLDKARGLMRALGYSKGELDGWKI
ncbi:MAG TPA: aminodeoxychorismate synthase component I [Clostridia bacterium]|nr:aminodeoxychorismate synthase component I [Clostridia bacterium]